MLIIRLQRTGRTQMPLYRIVLAEKHRHVSKKVIDYLGHYNPRTKELVLDAAIFDKWKDKVELSDTAHNLLVKNGYLTTPIRIPKFKPKKAAKA